jgi:hypothetical protein
MTCVVTSNGKRCLALISCHRNGSFSFFQYDRWVTARTVPYSVLYDAELPEEERRRVLWKMEELGVMPS